MPCYLSRENWIHTYSTNIPPIDISIRSMTPHTTSSYAGSGSPTVHPSLAPPGHPPSVSEANSDLESSDSESSRSSLEVLDPCEPLTTHPPRGRPSTKQKRRGDVRGPRAVCHNLAAEREFQDASMVMSSSNLNVPSLNAQVLQQREAATHCATR